MTQIADTPAAEMSPVDRLYAEVKVMCEAYCTAHDCASSTLGRVALGDSLFIKKIFDGESVTTEKLRKLELFLMNDPPSPKDARRREPEGTA